jgi:predicted membrane channel-forming protein YqfA (hemolysin III family)
MHIRTRKLIGTVALLVLVVVWALLAMGFAQMIGVSRNRLLEIAYYVVAGLGWVLPAMPLISWMSRADADAQATDEG